MKLRKYSVDFKLKCLDLASSIGYTQASKITGIDRKSLREWVINKEQFEKIQQKEKTFRLPGGGAKPKNPEIEEKKEPTSAELLVFEELDIDELNEENNFKESNDDIIISPEKEQEIKSVWNIFSLVNKII